MASDVASLVAELGGVGAVIGFYDARFGVTVTGAGVSQWDDARGASGFAPSMVQATDAARPAYSSSERTITFDGTADFLRAQNAFWNTVTGECAIATVCTGPAAQSASIQVIADLADATPNTAIRSYVPANDNNAAPNANGIDSTPQTVEDFVGSAGQRVVHAWRLADGTVGIRVGSPVGVMSSNTLVDVTATKLTVAGSSLGSPTLFAPIVVKAVIVIKGAYSVAMQDAVNVWASRYHGAVLA